MASHTGVSSSVIQHSSGSLVAMACGILCAIVMQPQIAAGAPEVPDGARAGAAEGGPEREPKAMLSLLVDREQARPGEQVRVGVLFELEEDWHLYWRFSGESGLPTQLDWNVTPLAGGAAASVGPLRWPAPSVFREDDGFITTYGYSDEVLLSADLDIPEAAGSQRIEVEADFLVCKIQCIPGRAKLVRELQVSVDAPSSTTQATALFDRAMRTVPVPAEELDLELEAVFSQSAIRPGDAFRAGIAVSQCENGGAGECRRLEPGTRVASDSFVPDELPGVELKTTGTRPHPTLDGGLIVTLEGRADADPFDGELRLRGVLALATDSGPIWADVDVEVPTQPAGAPVVPLEGADEWLTPTAQVAPATLTGSALLRSLYYAFLGGLILNLMPCVFPVLAIKVFGITEMAHAGRSRAVGQGLAYTAGVLASMAVLAGIVIALRAAGLAVGWGFQFQEPLFILGVGSVLVVFALNLFGVFEITPDLTRIGHVGAASTGHARSFFEGLLAVVLATPCSAPYLSVAVGVALVGSAPVILSVFLSIGLGLAAPYLLIACVPRLGAWLPRPGEWMVRVRSLLGFALLGTVIWLLSLLGSAVSAWAMALLLWVAFVTWCFGVLQASESRRAAAAVAVLGLASVVALSLRLPLDAPATAGTTGPERSAGLDAKRFERASVLDSLGAGTPVFVYFTADWCLTCKANERYVLDSDRVRSELDQLGFEVFVGDWTRRDDRIREELARFGRAAVPLYLVYSPSAPERPELLPEILTSDVLIDALKRAAPGRARAADPTAGGDRT